MSIEDRNYYNDARVRAVRAEIPTDMDDAPLPYRWEVCDLCDGKGTHVNPSIDSNGLTAEDFDEDPDFREEYMAGRYDQQCNQCGGRTTVPVVDVSRCTWAQKRHLVVMRRNAVDDAEYDRISAMERSMGA